MNDINFIQKSTTCSISNWRSQTKTFTFSIIECNQTKRNTRVNVMLLTSAEPIYHSNGEFCCFLYLLFTVCAHRWQHWHYACLNAFSCVCFAKRVYGVRRACAHVHIRGCMSLFYESVCVCYQNWIKYNRITVCKYLFASIESRSTRAYTCPLIPMHLDTSWCTISF